jgi:hypothetical protein
MSWAGHVAWMEEVRCTKIIKGKTEWMRLQGRPRREFYDNIKMVLK